MSGMTWLMLSLTTADAEKSKQLPGAPSTDARAPAYAIMCCCPLGGSIPGAPNRASGEALGVGGRRRRPANAGRGVQLLTQPTGGEGFGILSSDAYSLQAAPPASCSSRCGSGLCFASVASVMKELTLLQDQNSEDRSKTLSELRPCHPQALCDLSSLPQSHVRSISSSI